MDPEKSSQLFVNTSLNYVHFDETPDLYKHTEKNRIYFYGSPNDESKVENLLDSSETVLNDSSKELVITSPTCNLSISALCKSSSSESDACSSTRLLDNHHDHDPIVAYELSFKTDEQDKCSSTVASIHPPLSTMIEMSQKYQASDINYTNLKPTASPIVSQESETFWSKIHSSMSTKLRRCYLERHPSSHSPSHQPSSTPFCSSLRFCPSKPRLSTLLLCSLVICAFIILLAGLLTVTEFSLWNSLIAFHSKSKFSFHGSSSSHSSLPSTSSSSPSLSTSSLNGQTIWWRDALVYEIFVASFKDSDSDGFGDIKGLHEKLPYLRTLGVNVIRLNSIFSALDYPYSYENVINFTRLDPHLGHLTDLTNLVQDVHSQGMKLILDINLSITSDQHPWVANWLTNSSASFNYHYVNKSSITVTKDSSRYGENWMSNSHSSSSSSSSSLHLHHHPFGGYFYLNWSHPFVQSNMISCLQFWLQHGVDGFYLVNLDSLYLDPDYPEAIIDILDNIRSHVTSFRPHTFPGEKILAANRQSLDLINERLRSARADQLLNPFDSHETLDFTVSSGKHRKHGKPLTPSSSLTHSSMENEKNVYSYFDWVNIFITIELNSTEIIRDQVNGYFLNAPKSRPLVLWSIGTATKSRLATRIGKDYTLVSTFLLVMLPGSINFFYGDEIGLANSIDPASGREYRQGQLCPVPWTSELNGNFSGGNLTHPWLPINTNYLLNNIQRESETIDRLRSLIVFREHHLRSDWTEKQGNYLFHYVNQGFIGLERYFTRTLVNGNVIRHRFVLFANIGTIGRIKDFTDKFHFGTIKVTSNVKRIHDFLYLRSLSLDPGEALIAEME
uniref:alpha-glucosidase n=1 Tax=Tetranychus urticae TaxID=32264 RepID=T1JVH0_TETUR